VADSGAENVLVAERIRKEFDEVVALKGVDLAVPKGEVFGLIGPNGAGKTTLLNILATTMRADYGRARIAGYDVEKDPLSVRRLVGYMPDFFSLYENMTAEDFIAYFGLAFGVDKKILPQRVDDLLVGANLVAKRDANIRDLSRGMRQRLVFAKTLVHDPELLLLDEPLSGLDPMARMEMREMLKAIRERGKTIIVSSHILSELSDFCTMVGIIEQGELKIVGRIDEILARFSGERLVTIEVLADGKAAREVVEGIAGVKLLDGDGEVIEVRIKDRELIADVNAALVGAGFKVVSLVEQKGDIEDIYFRVAGHEVM